MTAPTQKANLAARMGGWSAHHRKAAVLVWFGFVIGAVAIGIRVGTRDLTMTDSLAGDSATAQRILDRAGLGNTSSERVLIEAKAHTVSDAAFRSAINATVAAVSAEPYVSHVRSPRNDAALVSHDRHAALVTFDIRGQMMDRAMRIVPVLHAVARTDRAHTGFGIEEFGSASFGSVTMESANSDLHRAELFSIPVTVLILFLAFGAFVAALLPVLLSLTAIVGAVGLVFVTSHLFPVDGSVYSVMLLIGLAVGVDYSLFYIRREREERAAGRSADAALSAAAATSGHSVLISGATVIAAVGGMFFAGTGGFRGIAMGTILVVATSVAGSLTVLPALLSKLGDRIESGRLPLGRGHAALGDRFWAVALGAVLRKPFVSAVAATGVLVALAVPALWMHTVQPTLTDYPSTLPIHKTYDRLNAAFPDGPLPAQIVVKADDARSPSLTRAVRRFEHAVIATGEFKGAVSDRVIDTHVVAISVPLAPPDQDAVWKHQISTLRSQLIPWTLANAPGVETAVVGGDSAGTLDYTDALRSHAPIVFAFVLTLAFLLLLLTFRSIVIPLKAIVLNLLSVGAAYGLLVAIFQWGWGESILGFESTGGVTSWVPPFLFVVLFGLSMDYHVFILSRVREAVDGGMETKAAVASGIHNTAGVVSSAALVMVAVFSIFGTLTQVSMKQLGVGLAFAVLLDATVVRAVLLPTTMTLLGERNWWLPSWLEWLPSRSAGTPAPPRRPRERSIGVPAPKTATARGPV